MDENAKSSVFYVNLSMKDFEMLLQDRIKQIREHFGLSQAHFAQRINKSPGFISLVETGRSNVSDETIETICSPYEKGVYFPAEESAEKISVGAERIRRLRKRKRKRVLEELLDKHSEEALWAAVVEFQGYKFHTYSGLPFSYRLKKGRRGEYTKELFIDRRENSKSLAWSSVKIAFEKALERRDTVFSRPKEIADVRGISYSYSMLWRFGVIRVPEAVDNKLRGKKQ